MEDFIDYLLQDYSSIISSSLESSLIQFLVDKLQKNSWDLSLNRLQIYTKEIGLFKYIQISLRELEIAQKQELSKEVFMELAECKEVLRVEEEEARMRKMDLEEWEQELVEKEERVNHMLRGKCVC
jgi:adenine-specific DNA methylase